jgi:hypothetical protein
MSYVGGPGDDPMFRVPAWSNTAAPPMSAWPNMPEGSAGGRMKLTSESSILSGSSIRGYSWLMGGFFVAFLAYLIYLQTRTDVADNGTLRSISDLFVLFGAATCTVVCWYTAVRLRNMQSNAGMLAGRAWISWACLGGAAFTYSVGQAIWTWYDGHYISSQLPFPAIYDPFYLSVYPLGWIGIALLIPRGGTAAGRTRLLLDAGIAVASVLAISWYFILGPTIGYLSGSTIEKIVALAYPLGDLSLAVAAALLLFGPSGTPALNGALGRLAIGVTLLAVTDSLYGYLQLQGVYHTGLLQDIGWPMSWLFIGFAALVYPQAVVRLTGQRLTNDELRSNSRLNTTGAAIRAITPIVIAVITCAVLLLVVALRNVAPVAQVVIVCAGLLLLPVIRQLLTLIDNMLLNERLRVALGQSQEAYQQSQQALMATSSRAERYDALRAGIENLQAVHAQLAHGDLSARAVVQGPLTPVAQSLNLLIDRLNNWVKFAQVNRVLEGEADQLREMLDRLSQGQVTSLPPTHSSLATGAALLSAGHLQRQLSLHFGRIRGTLSQFGRTWNNAAQSVQGMRYLLQQQATMSNQSDMKALHDSLSQIERELENNRTLIQDIWRDASVYAQSPDGRGMPQNNRASDGLLLGEP